MDDVIQYYAARAPIYDETAGYTDPEAEELRVPIKARYQETFRGRDVLEIACGSGYWTVAVGEVAKSMLAIDINQSLISIAEGRCKHLANVRFQIADAYTLHGVPAGFDAALGIWWWSHIPKGRLETFLAALHSKLAPGGLVLFVDQLPYNGFARKRDEEGNVLEQRILPDGRSFMIVKNFPTQEEVVDVLADIADEIQYIERLEERSWSVLYRTKKIRL